MKADCQPEPAQKRKAQNDLSESRMAAEGVTSSLWSPFTHPTLKYAQMAAGAVEPFM